MATSYHSGGELQKLVILLEALGEMFIVKPSCTINQELAVIVVEVADIDVRVRCHEHHVSDSLPDSCFNRDSEWCWLFLDT